MIGIPAAMESYAFSGIATFESGVYGLMRMPSGLHTYADEEIPDFEDALRRGLYMVRGPARTNRLHTDPVQEPKVRYCAK